MKRDEMLWLNLSIWYWKMWLEIRSSSKSSFYSQFANTLFELSTYEMKGHILGLDFALLTQTWKMLLNIIYVPKFQCNKFIHTLYTQHFKLFMSFPFLILLLLHLNDVVNKYVWIIYVKVINRPSFTPRDWRHSQEML